MHANCDNIRHKILNIQLCPQNSHTRVLGIQLAGNPKTQFYLITQQCVNILAGFRAKGRDEVAETQFKVIAEAYSRSSTTLQDRFPNKPQLQYLNRTEYHENATGSELPRFVFVRISLILT